MHCWDRFYIRAKSFVTGSVDPYGAASLVLGIYIWRLDVANAFSPPDAWWQGHAIFHLIMAVTLGAMAQFFRSEVPRPHCRS